MNEGMRIKARREELGMTQDELAKKLGYKSRSSINKIELGERKLTQSKIVAIAEALDVSPLYILGLEETHPVDFMMTLDNDETVLIENYRKLSDENRRRLLETARILEVIKND